MCKELVKHDVALASHLAVNLVKSVAFLKVGYRVEVSGERHASATSTLFIHWIEGGVRPTFGMDYSEKKISLYGEIFGDVLAKGLIVRESEFVRCQRQGWLQRWHTLAHSGTFWHDPYLHNLKCTVSVLKG
jgi:hypothetical protein